MYRRACSRASSSEDTTLPSSPKPFNPIRPKAIIQNEFLSPQTSNQQTTLKLVPLYTFTLLQPHRASRYTAGLKGRSKNIWACRVPNKPGCTAEPIFKYRLLPSLASEGIRQRLGFGCKKTNYTRDSISAPYHV